MAQDLLLAAHSGWQVETVPIKTTGDRVQDQPLADLGGKALWTKELDQALLAGDVDACVHSAKDVETVRPAAICIAAMLPRADVRDRLVGADSIEDLKFEAVIGTSSPRRSAQLRRRRPDLRIVPIRGNVTTRLRKLNDGEVDALVLAAAGLGRLNLDVGVALATDLLMPSPGQGAICIEALNDGKAREIVAAVNDGPTSTCVRLERAFLASLGGGCRSPVAAFAKIEDDVVTFVAELLSADGSERVSAAETAPVGEFDAGDLARRLLALAPSSILSLLQ